MKDISRKLDARIDQWKNKLLDLTGRNRLLNFKETKGSSLRFELPAPESLWDRLVIRRRPFLFPRPGEEPSDTTKLRSGNEELDVGRTLPDLAKVLKTLRNRSKTYVEEQGLNVLFLTFGLLRWSESGSSDLYEAPLVLVPVRITCSSISDPFAMMATGEEAVANPTLAYKLSREFGVELPEFDEEAGIGAYFKEVERAVGKSGWTVGRQSLLGLFPYQKITMYQDLERRRAAIVQHPVIRAIAGDPYADIPDGMGTVDLDSLDPVGSFQVVDADASQQEAIECAKRGDSFVLQGPPGTGKSQTITNIIAELMAQGKKVLFVSEKKAALEVVHRRLAQVGLADLCFVLHDVKQDKREVVVQLNDALTEAMHGRDVVDGGYRSMLGELGSKRDCLKAYAHGVGRVVQPLGRSLYDVQGELTSLADYAYVPFPLEGVEAVDPQRYGSYVSCVSSLADAVRALGCPVEESPWYGMDLSSCGTLERQGTVPRLVGLGTRLGEAARLGSELFDSLGVRGEVSVEKLRALCRVLELSRQGTGFPAGWVHKKTASAVRDKLDGLQSLWDEVAEARDRLREGLGRLALIDSRLDLVREPLESAADVRSLGEKLHTAVRGDRVFSGWAARYGVEELRALRAELQDGVDGCARLRAAVLQECTEDVFDLDCASMLRRFRDDYTSGVKRFFGGYRRDCRELRGCLRDPGSVSDDDLPRILEAVDSCERSRKALRSDHRLADAFGPYSKWIDGGLVGLDDALEAYGLLVGCTDAVERLFGLCVRWQERVASPEGGLDPFVEDGRFDFERAREALDEAEAVGGLTGLFGRDASRIARIAGSPGAPGVSAASALAERVGSLLEGAEDDLLWYGTLCGGDLRAEPLPQVLERLQRRCSDPSGLLPWADYCSCRDACERLGLGGFVDAARRARLAVADYVGTFKKAFLLRWLSWAEGDCEPVRLFRAATHERAIERFSELDKGQFAFACGAHTRTGGRGGQGRARGGRALRAAARGGEAPPHHAAAPAVFPDPAPADEPQAVHDDVAAVGQPVS